MRHCILVSGKDSLATALLQTAYAPQHAYEYVFNDVGVELPETLAWLAEIEVKTGWPIHAIGKDLQESIVSRNGFLPSSRARYCTKEGKIQPLQKYLKDSHCTVYYGLRADEKRTGFVPLASSRITPAYPLRDANIDLAGVYAILDAQNLMPPSFHWARLFEAVDDEMRGAGAHDWEARLSRMERGILFAGRSRPNCYFCFFQRQYEWVWLHETHPGLFAQAQAFENVGSEYTWRSDGPLSALIEDEKREKIFQSRVRWVTRYVLQKHQRQLFALENEEEIASFSCGLMCGK